MTFRLSARSLRNLDGVHPDLRRVVAAALEASPIDFSIIEGVRTIERQKRLFDDGKSRTMKSRHIHGFAVDFMAYVDGVGTWEDKYYVQISDAVKAAAATLGIPIVCGIDWTSFRDADHIELDKHAYPDPGDEKLIA